MRRALLMIAVVLVASSAGLLAAFGLGTAGSAATPEASSAAIGYVNTQVAPQLRPCPGLEMTDGGIFVRGITCDQAIANINTVEHADNPAMWCPSGWVVLKSTRAPTINPAGSGRAPLAVCFHQTRSGVQAYTMDVEALG